MKSLRTTIMLIWLSGFIVYGALGYGIIHFIIFPMQGRSKADSKLRDDDIDAYFGREVKPHVFGAWLDRSKDKIRYEINFTRHFYTYTPSEPPAKLKADILKLEEETEGLLQEILT
ncbi:MAG: hypothetical protein GY801_31105 [bacterium]|nr:hypothetical protein [bacterium]